MLTFVKNKHGQISLVAAERFKKNEVVFDLDMGEFLSEPELRTIEIGENLHVLHPYGMFTNHSCSPTCYVDKDDKVMRAARDIEIGEEINFNYMASETNPSTSFQCHCGSPNCIGFVGGTNSKPSHL